MNILKSSLLLQVEYKVNEDKIIHKTRIAKVTFLPQKDFIKSRAIVTSIWLVEECQRFMFSPK